MKSIAASSSVSTLMSLADPFGFDSQPTESRQSQNPLVVEAEIDNPEETGKLQANLPSVNKLPQNSSDAQVGRNPLKCIRTFLERFIVASPCVYCSVYCESDVVSAIALLPFYVL